MKKFLSALGKKNIIIISGIVLIGVAVYLNLTLGNTLADESIYTAENVAHGGSDMTNEYNSDEKIFGQSALVDNQDIESVSFEEFDEPYDDYFAVAAVNRQRARDESLELLQTVADTPDADESVKSDALAGIAKVAAEIECEANIETIILAKGFEECVAVVKGDNANIIVKTGGLMPNEIAIIKEIVYEQAAILPANTKIIEKN